MAIDVGAAAGPYEVVALIGEGGMGRVFRARDTRLKREVALKTLPSEFARDEERVARFRREAEALAALNHSHIAAIHDLVESEGTPFLVLELVAGETLADRLGRGPIPLAEAIGFARQIAGALEAAHGRGIVHRDLKPANIKITPAGQIKILDFGLAKVFDVTDPTSSSSQAVAANSPTFTSPAMTKRGVILGTAAYMSPEQARGQAVGTQADIWAFGCVLYEMLTGQPAFDGATVTDVLAAVVRSDPEWSRLPRETPSGTRTVLRRSLQKDTRQRWHHIADARLELDDVGAEPATPTAAPAAARPGGARLPWMIAAVAGLTAIGLGAALMRGVEAPVTPKMRVSIETPPYLDPLALALSPDGQKIVFGGVDGASSRLWLRLLGEMTARPLSGTELGTLPFWSPDSRSIAFFADARLKRLDLGANVTTTLAGAPIGAGGTWNRDGVIVFAPSVTGPLFQVPAGGGGTTQITTLQVPSETGHRLPYFLPDGRHFIFSVRGLDAGVYLGSLDGSPTRRLVQTDSSGLFAAGNLLWARSGVLFAQPFDLQRLETSGEAISVAENVAFDDGLSMAAFTTDGGGLLVYRPGGASQASQLTWFDRGGRSVGTLGPMDTARLLNPDLSHDGDWVVVNRNVDRFQDIWLIDVRRTVFSRLTLDPFTDQVPVWHPDGRRVVYSSNRIGPYNLYERPINGTGEDRLILASSENKFPMGFSPDGQYLLYRSTAPNTDWDLWVLPLGSERGSGTPIPIARTTFQEMMGEFSPDGRWIAYQSNESGQYEIYVRSFPGMEVRLQISTRGGAQPRWRRDGRELFYIALDGRLTAVALTLGPDGRLVPAEPKALFMTRTPGGPVPIPQKQQYAVSLDGQRFLINRLSDEGTGEPLTLIVNWQPPPAQ
jgi:Tol biopolymer transport system component/aminoglycoside phosphotransferase (APT) family kinase protein